MTEEMKQAHLNFEHKGKEQEFAGKGCDLCKAFLDGLANPLLGAEDLAVDIRENITLGEAIN
jgi:hypothetical protein